MYARRMLAVGRARALWSAAPRSAFHSRRQLAATVAPARPTQELEKQVLAACFVGLVQKLSPLEALNRNARRAKKPNHGARPCSSHARKWKRKQRMKGKLRHG
mmetsp:Transcript_11590/g.43254  ORF Transcript_11590/g.43254 Transcript_11590/m.43254 type:complete len:103 (-) Transcript_11590:77-385(-)